MGVHGLRKDIVKIIRGKDGALREIAQLNLSDLPYEADVVQYMGTYNAVRRKAEEGSLTFTDRVKRQEQNARQVHQHTLTST